MHSVPEALAGGRTAPWPAFYPAGARPPAGIDPIEFGSMAPWSRGLLVIDGTVTTFLEALAGEAIAVVQLGQTRRSLATAEPALGAAAGTPCIHRSVVLRGSATGRVYALARSLIVPGRLPATLCAALESGGTGIGQVLRTPGFDSRREGLWFGRAASVPEVIPGVAGQAGWLVRAYCVLGAGVPVMLITEYFPWDLRLG